MGLKILGAWFESTGIDHLKEFLSEIPKVNYLESVKAEIRLLEACRAKTKNILVIKDIDTQIKSWQAIKHLIENSLNN